MPNLSPRLKHNNFDLLRLLFALIVCLVHSYELTRFEELRWIASALSSNIAVNAFFIISGFLIIMSYERSSSLASYTNKRLRRIYPAYLTVIMICAVGLFFVSNATVQSYFSLDWIKYLLANALFLNFLAPSLPGVFESHALNTVNGALWTLKIEVMFYLCVPLIVYLLRRFGHWQTLLTLYCLSIAYSAGLNHLGTSSDSPLYAILARQLPGQLCYFLAGAFLYYFLDHFERYVKYYLSAAIAIMLANTLIDISILTPAALAILVVFFGLYFFLGNVGKYGDFSYGVYILHFPIIQLLLWSDKFQDAPYLFLSSVIAITALSAFLLWHGVEKHFLKRNNHYITTNNQRDKNETKHESP